MTKFESILFVILSGFVLILGFIAKDLEKELRKQALEIVKLRTELNRPQ